MRICGAAIRKFSYAAKALVYYYSHICTNAKLAQSHLGKNGVDYRETLSRASLAPRCNNLDVPLAK